MIWIRKLLKSKGVDEFIVFLEVMIVAQEEDHLIDVILTANGRA